MELFLFLICLIAAAAAAFFFKKSRGQAERIDTLSKSNKKLTLEIMDKNDKATTDSRQIYDLKKQINTLEELLEKLSKYQKIIDIEGHIQSEKDNLAQYMKLKEEEFKEFCDKEKLNLNAEKAAWGKEKEAELWLFNSTKKEWEQEKNQSLESLKLYKRMIVSEANALKNNIKIKTKEVENFLEEHKEKEMLLIENEAKQLLGEYYGLANEKLELSKIVKALENKIHGYSDEYLLPAQTLLDDLIDGYDHLDAAQRLKQVKLEIKTAIKQGVVAECDYVEDLRKNTAIAFITNAFNGKADVHASRLRHDNVGKLVQALKDDYLLLNNYGQAFRNARINPSYLALRTEELKWGAIVLDFREKEREEQRAIREQIKEEEKALKEYERAIRDAEKEEQLLRKAYEKAKREFEKSSDDQKAIYDREMSDLLSKLKEAEEKNERALSMAQQTRAGHVYIISNIGSFGDNVLKLGMTRRLEPMDRVKELGDASVPFTFDVHAMIYSEDAPTLEKMLHHYFNHQRVNKVNYKKEFFRVALTDVKNYLEEQGIQAKFTLKAEALQYRESLRIEALPDDEQRKLEDKIEEIESRNKQTIPLECE